MLQQGCIKNNNIVEINIFHCTTFYRVNYSTDVKAEYSVAITSVFSVTSDRHILQKETSVFRMRR